MICYISVLSIVCLERILLGAALLGRCTCSSSPLPDALRGPRNLHASIPLFARSGDGVKGVGVMGSLIFVMFEDTYRKSLHW